MSEQRAPRCILSINAGSSSLKLQVFRVSSKDGKEATALLIKSSISGLNSSPVSFTYRNIKLDESENIDSKELHTVESGIDAFRYFLDQLGRDKAFGKKDEITHVCHRIVHGGELGGKGPASVNQKVIEELESITTLAPLHNGPAISILKATTENMPEAKNIAFFDSSFHNSIPDFITTYPIDQKIAKEKKLRKYGFHGISYEWILKNVSKHLGKDRDDVSLIALHLGSGASMCAIKKGKSYDTTMGLTPLDGLPGGSRSGSIDPSLIFHHSSRPADTDKIPPSVELSHAENILNTSSGFKALAGTSDFSKVLSEDPRTDQASLTINLFLDRILGYFGSYWLKLRGGKGGVDAIVFAGGIGEGSPEFREMIVEGLEGLNGDFERLDKGKNKKDDSDQEDWVVRSIGTVQGSIKLLVCRTNEELQMAEECIANKSLW